MPTPVLARIISRSTYGLIITAALLVAVEHTMTNSWTIVISILTSLLSISIAEAYTEGIGAHIEKKGQLEHEERRSIVKESLYIFGGSTFPVLAFVISGWGLLSLQEAFLMAKIFIVVTLFEYGYVYGRRIGRSRLGSLRVAFLNIVMVLLIVAFKEFVHV